MIDWSSIYFRKFFANFCANCIIKYDNGNRHIILNIINDIRKGKKAMKAKNTGLKTETEPRYEYKLKANKTCMMEAIRAATGCLVPRSKWVRFEKEYRVRRYWVSWFNEYDGVSFIVKIFEGFNNVRMLVILSDRSDGYGKSSMTL